MLMPYQYKKTQVKPMTQLKKELTALIERSGGKMKDDVLQSMIDLMLAEVGGNVMEEINMEFQSLAIHLADYHGVETISDRLAEIKNFVRTTEAKIKNIEIPQVDQHATLKELSEMVKKINSDDKTSIKYRLCRFPQIEKYTLGLQPGFYVFAAEPNVGKSALMQNILIDLMMNNEDATCVYYSFDDSMKDTLKRLVALLTRREDNTAFPAIEGDRAYRKSVKIYNTTKKQWVKDSNDNWKIDDDRQAQLNLAYCVIADMLDAGRLIIYDRRQVRSIDDLDLSIKDLAKKNKNLVIFVDGVAKIQCHGFKTSFDVEGYKSEELDRIAIEYDIPVLTTNEKRKADAKDKGKKPTMDDVKGNSRVGFDSKFTAMMYPEDREAYKARANQIIILYVDKNKITEYTGEIKLRFESHYCYFSDISCESSFY